MPFRAPHRVRFKPLNIAMTSLYVECFPLGVSLFPMQKLYFRAVSMTLLIASLLGLSAHASSPDVHVVAAALRTVARVTRYIGLEGGPAKMHACFVSTTLSTEILQWCSRNKFDQLEMRPAVSCSVSDTRHVTTELVRSMPYS